MYETCINVYVSIAVCMFVDANKCSIEWYECLPLVLNYVLGKKVKSGFIKYTFKSIFLFLNLKTLFLNF